MGRRGGIRKALRRYTGGGLRRIRDSAIPPRRDQLLLGTLGRTMAKSPRAMFILGANEGGFPHYFNDDGMINDRELDHLASMGAKTWGRSAEKAEGELMDLYCALAAPKEFLYISYTMSAGTDAACPRRWWTGYGKYFQRWAYRPTLSRFAPVSEGSPALRRSCAPTATTLRPGRACAALRVVRRETGIPPHTGGP